MENQKLNFQEVQKKQSPKELFANLEKYTDMVVKHIQPSILLTGGPGLGKTYMVNQRLKHYGLKNGIDYIIVKGRTTGAGLFRVLYENSDRIIVFDDCDSVFDDKDGVNLLKAALDSYDTRTISYIGAQSLRDQNGEMIPSQFNFTGQVIFISNKSQKSIDSAIRSRSFTFDLELTPEQLLERMQDKLEEMEPRVSMKEKQAALNCLKQVHAKFEGVELNFRSLVKAIRIKQAGFDNWHMMVAEQCIDPNVVSKKAKAVAATAGQPTKAELLAEKAKGKTWLTIEKELGISGHTRLKTLRS